MDSKECKRFLFLLRENIGLKWVEVFSWLVYITAQEADVRGPSHVGGSGH